MQTLKTRKIHQNSLMTVTGHSSAFTAPSCVRHSMTARQIGQIKETTNVRAARSLLRRQRI